MNKTMGTLHRAREFAGLTGVTVRTLHHYDRLGLLKPSGRTAAGYRLYGERDFARLQQIATLKFIGLPLKQIKGLLERNTLDLAATLRLQREVIEGQRRRLDMALRAIERAERVVATGGEPDWEAFKKIIEVINMQNDMEWTDKYYSEEAKEKLAGMRDRIPPEVIEQGQRDWAELIGEVEAAVSAGVDPASERAQSLAARWSKLIGAFTGGDPAISEGLNKLYADKANWPSAFPKPYSDEAGAFICQAAAAHKKG
ncbi:MAG: MerR family transcriptional regulator [Acidobacteria bacterium]|nr:MerR family transcriptional regulator [Acidobacteriota bacterium]